MFLLEFTRHGHVRIFEDLLERMRFLERAVRIGQRRDIHLLAWSLEASYARLLVHADLADLRPWVRLVQSGHGVDLFHRGRGYVDWAAPVPLPMGAVEEGLEILYYMAPHSPWCSAWEAAGARRWPGIPDPAERLPREVHLLAAGLDAIPRVASVPSGVSWSVLSQALTAATGRPVTSKQNAVAAHQLAHRCGHRIPVISEVRGVSTDAVRKSLRAEERPEVARALCWITDPRLKEMLDTASFRRACRPPVF